jgi:transcriptional regulator with XRE-family HTH domain
MNLSIALSEIVKKRRLVLDLTQQELADKAGLHRTFVSRFERGLTEMSIHTLTSVAAALRTRPSKLLLEAEELQRLSNK